MDFHRSKAEGRRPVSVLEGEGSYFHRILSREPSVGDSNRYYLYRNPGQIPFQWEKQPGKCKFDPPKKDPVNVPSISPPPTSASKIMELPSRPNHGGGFKGYSLSWSKMKFWRKIKSKKQRLLKQRSKNQARGSGDANKFSFNGWSFTSSDDNLASSSSNSRSSASSSSASSLSFGAPSR